MSIYDIEYTDIDTFSGRARYSWVRRASVTMPEMTHYGYDGSTNYLKTRRVFKRELMRRAKAAVGLTGVRGVRHDCGDIIEFRPYGSATIMFIVYRDE